MYIDDDTLSYILDMVGEDEYMFTGLVNKKFNNAYKVVFKSTNTSLSNSMNSLERFNEFIDITPEQDDDYLFNKMIEYDKPLVANRILEMGHEFDHFCVQDAIEYESFNFIKWLHFDSSLAYIPSNTYAHASNMYRVDYLNFLLENKIGYPDSRCKLETFEWYENMSNDISYKIIELIREDDIETIRGTFHTYRFSSCHLTEACISGSIEVFYHLLYNESMIPSERDINICKMMHRDLFLSEIEQHFKIYGNN